MMHIYESRWLGFLLIEDMNRGPDAPVWEFAWGFDGRKACDLWIKNRHHQYVTPWHLKAQGARYDGGLGLDMLGVFAEFETNLRRERQAEGIAKAKERGVYKGRKPTIDPAAVKALKGQGLGASAIARELGIGRASVYRVLA